MVEAGSPEIVFDNNEQTSLERITRGEVDMQVSTAKRYPRSIQRFKQDALSMATLDQETASSCFYVLPRDGKSIDGPGVRLAEIVASCWGNLRAEARVIEEGDKFVTSQGTAWDLERNVLVRMEVKRRITNKSGKRYSDDMIVTTGNAASAIAFRNAVFKVIPSAYVKSIYEAVRKVSAGDERTLSVRRLAALDWFEKAGVKKDRVLALLGKQGVDDINLDDLVTLQGLRTAIQEGTTSIEEAFPVEAQADVKPPEGKVKLGGHQAPAAVETKPEATVPAPQKTAEQVMDERDAEEKSTTAPLTDKEKAWREKHAKKTHERDPGADG